MSLWCYGCIIRHLWVAGTTPFAFRGAPASEQAGHGLVPDATEKQATERGRACFRYFEACLGDSSVAHRRQANVKVAASSDAFATVSDMVEVRARVAHVIRPWGIPGLGAGGPTCAAQRLWNPNVMRLNSWCF